MQLDVTVQIEDEDVLAGRLYQNVRHGDETATFSYAASYLDDPRAFTLAPDMPLGPGTQLASSSACATRRRSWRSRFSTSST